MDARVGVLDADAIGTEMLLRDPQHGVVGALCAQSRCSSSITDSAVTGFAPAWIIRFIALSWANVLTSPQQSSTT